MSKHIQESEIEFRREEPSGDYPVSRGIILNTIIVYQYGGDLEECVQEARKTFGLGKEWRVVRSVGAEA